ncbi:MAG TPA: bi-domain-containing oxidoreductase [Pyrinomonadaceae bacterium]|jgi:predicted dehydrogenase/threonine dehydrogenase-like Zn-dependent dehydrogenase|nr:bi-domain-containing oxidoreductase [Pyrinomonadaceae bacterium]
MKQVVQNFKSGELLIAEVPTPTLRARGVLVHTCSSLVSAGTERMVVDFAEKNILQKARARPDLVRQVLDKAQREGVLTTIDSVRNRLDQPLPLGYSSAGVVVAVGKEAGAFQVGDRVACAGGGYAGHAEVAYIPRNLAVKLAANVSFDAGAFTTIGAVALQGIRQSEIVLGNQVAVIGLGLLGQLTVQLLKAAGCRVFGLDLNAQRVALALEMGADLACTNASAVANAQLFTANRGFDAVLITADTESSEPVKLAGEIARNRGIVVAVGAVGMHIPRKVYYEKELDFRLSRSYGPGRYDPDYEEKGQDYPYGYVRWTEQRNMEAFAQLLAEGKVNIDPLITHRFSVRDAIGAYNVITGKTNEPFLGVLLNYPETPHQGKIILGDLQAGTTRKSTDGHLTQVGIGVLGAGNFANATLLPALKGIEHVKLIGIASASGLSAQSTAKRFKFDYCAPDFEEILNDPNINTVAVLTRHHLHARQVIQALHSGKNVFVEKPLCLTEEELHEIIAAHREAISRAAFQKSGAPALMVGFNRRFAPFILELKQHLRSVGEPLMLNYRVNAGYIPPEHWIQDPVEGGGRLLGEGCHFIDLVIDLAGSSPRRVTTHVLPDGGRYSQDNLSITLNFDNGSLATITYVANGNKSFSKESLEVFGGGLSARLDDYRSLLIRTGSKKIERKARLRQDKGHRAEWQAFVSHLTGKGPEPVSFEAIVRSMKATLAAHHSVEMGEPVVLQS